MLTVPQADSTRGNNTSPISHNECVDTLTQSLIGKQIFINIPTQSEEAIGSPPLQLLILAFSKTHIYRTLMVNAQKCTRHRDSQGRGSWNNFQKAKKAAERERGLYTIKHR